MWEERYVIAVLADHEVEGVVDLIQEIYGRVEGLIPQEFSKGLILAEKCDET